MGHAEDKRFYVEAVSYTHLDVYKRQSLMNYSKKYGVSRASRKYNKSRSYIYFWLKRWDGSVESLAVKSVSYTHLDVYKRQQKYG